MKTWCLLTSLLQLSHAEALLPRTKKVPNNANDKALVQSCKKLCKIYFEEKLDMTLCRPALQLLPRNPTIYQSCVAGRKSGFEKVCHPACIEIVSKNDRDVHKIDVFPDSYSSCKAFKGRSERFDWCRRGYDLTFEEAKHTISNFITLEHSVPTENETFQDNKESALVREEVYEYISAKNETFQEDEKESALIQEINIYNDHIITNFEGVNDSNKKHTMVNDSISSERDMSGNELSGSTSSILKPNTKSDNTEMLTPNVTRFKRKRKSLKAKRLRQK